MYPGVRDMTKICIPADDGHTKTSQMTTCDGAKVDEKTLLKKQRVPISILSPGSEYMRL